MVPRTSVTLDDGGIIIRRNCDAECVEKCEEVELKHKRTWLQPHEMANPRPCVSVAPDTPEVEKLCTIAECLEQLKTTITNIDPIANFDGNVVSLGKCTPDGRDIIFCIKKDPNTGELLAIDAFALTGSDWEPYDGECVDCIQKEWQLTGLEVANPAHPNYCAQTYFCYENGVPTGVHHILNQSNEFEAITVSDDELNVPGADDGKVFEAETQNVIIEHATAAIATVADALVFAEAAGLPDMVCKETGQSIPTTAADLCSFKVQRVPCKGSYINDAGVQTTVPDDAEDTLFVDSVSINKTGDDPFAGVNTADAVVAGADAVSVWCFGFQSKLTKAEISALPEPTPPEPGIPEIVQWNHNADNGTSNAGSTAENNQCIADAADIVFGAGVQFPAEGWPNGSNFEWVIGGVDTDSKDAAIAADDYVEFNFLAGADGVFSSWYQGLEPQPNASGAGDYEFCIAVSDDGFATSTVLLPNGQITDPQAIGGMRVNHLEDLPAHPIVAGGSYTVRYYMWNAGASGTTGSARFPGTDQSLPAGQVSVDDVQIGVECHP